MPALIFITHVYSSLSLVFITHFRCFPSIVLVHIFAAPYTFRPAVPLLPMHLFIPQSLSSSLISAAASLSSATPNPYLCPSFPLLPVRGLDPSVPLLSVNMFITIFRCRVSISLSVSAAAADPYLSQFRCCLSISSSATKLLDLPCLGELQLYLSSLVIPHSDGIHQHHHHGTVKHCFLSRSVCEASSRALPPQIQRPWELRCEVHDAHSTARKRVVDVPHTQVFYPICGTSMWNFSDNLAAHPNTGEKRRPGEGTFAR